nr:retrovirus-related Pol polyprotein from transposon TNT 1-94 [Tanacetum cinerariifolium]
MHDEFEMSMMGELNFFLGLQIKQMEDGIFSRPDIMFSVCLCARFQEAPKTSHLEAVKRIFRYIKDTTHLGLWYPKGTGIETVVHADSGYTGDYVDQKSTSEFAQILDIPCEGACVFTNKWSLDELANGVYTDGPYQTNPPSPDDIFLYIRIDREGQVRRIRHEKEIDVHEYQILTREIVPTLKPLEEIIQENVFCLGELSNESYVLYDHVMNPFTAHHERKTRKDHGTRRGRHSTSSSLSLRPTILLVKMMEMVKEPHVHELLLPFALLTY